MKHKWFIIITSLLILFWLLNTSRPGNQVDGCLSGCSTSQDKSAESLRIISLNMLHGFPKFENLTERLEIIIGEMILIDPDIILLQEVPWTMKTRNVAEYLAGRLGMNHVYFRANGNRWAIGFEEGEAILSRYPLKTIGFGELEPRAGLFEHRVVLHAVATTMMGDIGLYVTHLTNGDNAVNLKQSESLAEFVTTEGVMFAIIAGDFNAQPESSQIQALSSIWIDSFSDIDSAIDGYTCCNDKLDQKESFPNKRIDYIFLAPGTTTPFIANSERVFSQPYNVDNGWLWASDHLGLDIILRLGE